MKKICWEESVHIMHGRDVVVTMVTGTAGAAGMVQEALDRWWGPLMQMHGPRSDRAKDRDLYWRIKAKTSEELRQEFLSIYVPADLGARPDAARPGAAPRRGDRRVALHASPTGTSCGRSSPATARSRRSGSSSGATELGRRRSGCATRSSRRRAAAVA